MDHPVLIGRGSYNAIICHFDLLRLLYSSVLKYWDFKTHLVSSEYVVLSPVLSFRSAVKNLQKRFPFIWKFRQSIKQKTSYLKCKNIRNMFVSCLLRGTLESKLLVVTLKIVKTADCNWNHTCITWQIWSLLVYKKYSLEKK